MTALLAQYAALRSPDTKTAKRYVPDEVATWDKPDTETAGEAG